MASMTHERQKAVIFSPLFKCDSCFPQDALVFGRNDKSDSREIDNIVPAAWLKQARAIWGISPLF